MIMKNNNLHSFSDFLLPLEKIVFGFKEYKFNETFKNLNFPRQKTPLNKHKMVNSFQSN